MDSGELKLRVLGVHVGRSPAAQGSPGLVEVSVRTLLDPSGEQRAAQRHTLQGVQGQLVEVRSCSRLDDDVSARGRFQQSAHPLRLGTSWMDAQVTR